MTGSPSSERIKKFWVVCVLYANEMVVSLIIILSLESDTFITRKFVFNRIFLGEGGRGEGGEGRRGYWFVVLLISYYAELSHLNSE